MQVRRVRDCTLHSLSARLTDMTAGTFPIGTGRLSPTDPSPRPRDAGRPPGESGCPQETPAWATRAGHQPDTCQAQPGLQATPHTGAAGGRAGAASRPLRLGAPAAAAAVRAGSPSFPTAHRPSHGPSPPPSSLPAALTASPGNDHGSAECAAAYATPAGWAAGSARRRAASPLGLSPHVAPHVAPPGGAAAHWVHDGGHF